MNTAIVFDYLLADLGIDEYAIRNTLSLLGNGATIPFIARYRKEQTGGLDEVKIRDIAEKFAYYAELEMRKDAILKSITEQGKLTGELRAKIIACRQKYQLEDLYLPFRPRVRTRATVAREKGLEPLAGAILTEQPEEGDKEKLIASFISAEKALLSPEAVLVEAIEILIEDISERADVRAALRSLYLKKGVLVSKVKRELAGAKTKFEMYYDFSESLEKIPSHRMLAIRRGSKEKIISWEIVVPEDNALDAIRSHLNKNPRSIFRKELFRAIDTCYKRSLHTSIEIDVFRTKLQQAEKEAISVFSKNLRNLLLASPAGQHVIIGMDPGIRTGCKIAAVDRNGIYRGYHQVYLHNSDSQRREAEKVLLDMVKTYRAEIIAIGNGTASKETAQFVQEVARKAELAVKVLVVSEAGASVYSASDVARKEFPDLDVTVRGAISIARRLQDPLAELVKIDAKSIGVGQYQHDVDQTALKKALDATVESCVNYVGVELNTASRELLTYVSGIGPFLAGGIFDHRSIRGPFKDKRDLLKVPGIGAKVFEQCAGFLKIRESENPLNDSTIHPESFSLVERMAIDCGLGVKELINNEEALAKIDIHKYVTDKVGIPTLRDIISELKKPGIDPREEFSYAEFNPLINELTDLRAGLVLEGVVTNVTNFGAFVDIGVHQDGLVHISRMGRSFVRDPHEVVSVGDKIKVKVVAIDHALKRISLEIVRSDTPLR